jgi:hypothetical protein
MALIEFTTCQQGVCPCGCERVVMTWHVDPCTCDE